MDNRTINNVDEAILEKIRLECGSPVLIFDEESFVENYRNLENTFRMYYANYKIAYSYKTNYTPYVGRLVRKLGGLAEVVSDFEYYVAKKVGNVNCNIIYNGPYKQKLLEEHLLNGGIVNIDNLQECMRIVRYAREHLNHKFEVGVRVNIDVGQDFISRFGMDPQTEEFQVALKELKVCENISLIGLHCHVGQSREIINWDLRTKKMLALADDIFGDNPPKYIDLGSGMFGDMEPVFKEQFGDNVPTYDDYAKIVAGQFDEHYKNYSEDNKPILYTEPGATVASRYMWLLTTVTSHKIVRGRFVTGVDSSFFDAGETSRYKNLPIKIFNKSRDYIGGDIVGYTCLEDDLLYSNYDGYVAIGDKILLGNTGGYSLVFKPPFILPDIPVVALHKDESFELIKKRQTFEDMLENYI